MHADLLLLAKRFRISPPSIREKTTGLAVQPPFADQLVQWANRSDLPKNSFGTERLRESSFKTICKTALFFPLRLAAFFISERAMK